MIDRSQFSVYNKQDCATIIASGKRAKLHIVRTGNLRVAIAITGKMTPAHAPWCAHPNDMSAGSPVCWLGWASTNER